MNLGTWRNQYERRGKFLHTLVGSGVEVCFGNPGTSEMNFVGALDRVDGMRAILCLLEGAVTGAAGGYGRIAEKPAAKLLHLGPGLANGLADLHNARRASTRPIRVEIRRDREKEPWRRRQRPLQQS